MKYPLLLLICAPLLIAPLLQPAPPATPAKALAVPQNSAQSDAAQSDAAQSDAAQSEPAQSEPAQSEPAQSDPAQSEPAQGEDEEEKPFLLLASVHNYGYIEPCG